MTSKFADYLPIYGVHGILARHGLELEAGSIALERVDDFETPLFMTAARASAQVVIARLPARAIWSECYRTAFRTHDLLCDDRIAALDATRP